jgi:methyltransferase OMS1
MLDRSAVAHARRWGCWWNRDVQGLVAAAGLRVVECRRHHLGTTYAIVAAPQ